MVLGEELRAEVGKPVRAPGASERAPSSSDGGGAGAGDGRAAAVAVAVAAETDTPPGGGFRASCFKGAARFYPGAPRAPGLLHPGTPRSAPASGREEENCPALSPSRGDVTEPQDRDFLRLVCPPRLAKDGVREGRTSGQRCSQSRTDANSLARKLPALPWRGSHVQRAQIRLVWVAAFSISPKP